MSHVAFSGKTVFSIIILILVLALYLFANSPFFETDCVEWTGLVYLSSEQLDVYLALPLTNVWRLDPREVETLLLEHPWIEAVKVRWRWPNRIIINITEPVPLAQVPYAGDWFLLDREGNLLPSTERGIVYPLPIVTNLDLSGTELLKATARLLAMVPASLKESLSEWNVATRSFITRNGIEVLVGPPEELDEKFILLEKILDDLAANNGQAKRIDLRVPKNPVVTIL